MKDCWHYTKVSKIHYVHLWGAELSTEKLTEWKTFYVCLLLCMWFDCLFVCCLFKSRPCAEFRKDLITRWLQELLIHLLPELGLILIPLGTVQNTKTWCDFTLALWWESKERELTALRSQLGTKSRLIPTTLEVYFIIPEILIQIKTILLLSDLSALFSFFTSCRIRVKPGSRSMYQVWRPHMGIFQAVLRAKPKSSASNNC